MQETGDGRKKYEEKERKKKEEEEEEEELERDTAEGRMEQLWSSE